MMVSQMPGMKILIKPTLAKYMRHSPQWVNSFTSDPGLDTFRPHKPINSLPPDSILTCLLPIQKHSLVHWHLSMSVLSYGSNSLRYIPFPTKITSLINSQGLVDSDSPENHHNNRRNSESQRWPKTFWAVYVNSECTRIWCNRLKHYVV